MHSGVYHMCRHKKSNRAMKQSSLSTTNQCSPCVRKVLLTTYFRHTLVLASVDCFDVIDGTGTTMTNGAWCSKLYVCTLTTNTRTYVDLLLLLAFHSPRKSKRIEKKELQLLYLVYTDITTVRYLLCSYTHEGRSRLSSGRPARPSTRDE